MPLSNAEKQRRYRDRKRAEEEARSRYDRGLPPAPPEPVAPEGAYLTSNGYARAKYDHYERFTDGTFAALPDDLRGHESQPYAQYEARRREGEDIAGRGSDSLK